MDLEGAWVLDGEREGSMMRGGNRAEEDAEVGLGRAQNSRNMIYLAWSTSIWSPVIWSELCLSLLRAHASPRDDHSPVPAASSCPYPRSRSNCLMLICIKSIHFSFSSACSELPRGKECLSSTTGHGLGRWQETFVDLNAGFYKRRLCACWKHVSHCRPDTEEFT